MKHVLRGLIAVAVVGIVGVGVAQGGSKGALGVGERLGADRSFEAVAFNDSTIPGTARQRGKRAKIRFLSTEAINVPAGRGVAVKGQCPNNWKVTDGGFGTDGAIVADFLAPLNQRTFAFSVIDLANAPGKVAFTLTCIKP